ncbi:MAG: ABC transporter ATP-binding protein [Phycisphaerales bacterium]|nr:ABC transporter ATP-binding protein [Phycisphaerales bacterium]
MPTPEPEVVVQLDRLTKIYRSGAGVEVPALREVNATIRRGDYVAIVGPSGSGKSTLLNILGCLDRPTSGTYWLSGQDVSTLTDDQLSEIRGRRIGFIFQSFNLITTQSVLENLETPLFYQGVRPRQRREIALELIEKVGLRERLHHLPHELSGGQQQRVAIARALVNDPAILLADEPTGNLDSTTGTAILELLNALNRDGRTVIVVTHDQYVAARCRRVLEIFDGRVTEQPRGSENAVAGVPVAP